MSIMDLVSQYITQLSATWGQQVFDLIDIAGGQLQRTKPLCNERPYKWR